MKVIKGLLLFGLLAVGASSCFEPPEFQDTPKIDFDDLYFGVSPNIVEPDSIVISIRFQDGDGDLGLETNPNENPSHLSDPFHPANYFLEDNGSLTPVTTYTAYSDENPPRFFTPVLYVGTSQGKLATDRTRNKPEYSHLDLPPNVFPDKCYYYTDINLYVLGDDAGVIDDTYNIVDTLTEFDPPVYVVRESFYTEKNPNNFNILVDWLIRVQTPDGVTYEEYKWEEQSPQNGCGSSLNGRFPVATQSDNPLEGVIRYSIKSNGFLELFNTNTMRLRIQIKDRALHDSNIIETEDFTLSKILRP